MSNNRVLVPVLAGLGAAAAGVVVYAFAGRRLRSVPPISDQSTPEAEGAPALRESMVVPRATVPDPLEVDLDLDGIFRSPDPFQEQSDALTVQSDVKVPALLSADDAEAPSADELGAYSLSRATQSERSLDAGELELELEVELENFADARAEDAELEEDVEFEEVEPAAASGERRG